MTVSLTLNLNYLLSALFFVAMTEWACSVFLFPYRMPSSVNTLIHGAAMGFLGGIAAIMQMSPGEISPKLMPYSLALLGLSAAGQSFFLGREILRIWVEKRTREFSRLLEEGRAENRRQQAFVSQLFDEQQRQSATCAEPPQPATPAEPKPTYH